MVAWKRFPVPEFNYAEFQEMEWSAPKLQERSSFEAIAGKAAGGASPAAAYPVMLDDLTAHKYGLTGEHLHAIGCVVPPGGGHLLGRSHAWKIQRVIILNANDLSVVADWSTPRPMNTRIGPENGIELAAGSYLAICAHKYGEGWIGSRSITQAGLKLDGGRAGYRVLAASDDDLEDFNHVCLTLSWKA